MRMKGGEAFTGKTGNTYSAGEVIEVEHPDCREALIAGWELTDEPLPEPESEEAHESRDRAL